MTRKTIFISDLHLSEENTHLNHLFTVFIQETLLDKTNIDSVYILGDFFNVWLGDDMAGPWEKQIMEKLTQLVTAGIPVYFMQGNRDFLLEKPFVQAAKIIFLSDPACITLYGKKIILKHGDDLCTEDKSYQLFRHIVRSYWVKKLYLSLPLKWRKNIANRIRKNSMNRGMRESYAKVSVPMVEKLFRDNAAENSSAKSILIHGHTHRPQIEKISIDNIEHLHVILSDWNTRGNRLFLLSDGQINLDYFE